MAGIAIICDIFSRMRLMMRLILWVAAGVLPPLASQGAEWRFANEHIIVQAVNRTPDQMAGFYEARGFPRAMLDVTRTRCFITFLVRNKSKSVVWLDQSRWVTRGAHGAVTKVSRAQWFKQWEDMQMPLSSRSTFRWTLLPEIIDFHPGEGAGGNVTWEFPNGEFDLTMQFPVGAADSGNTISVELKGLQCARDN